MTALEASCGLDKHGEPSSRECPQFASVVVQMNQCRICGAEGIRKITVPDLQFRWCSCCLHCVTPPQMSVDEINQYYRSKPKWQERYERYLREGFIPPMQMRYVERSKYVVSQLARNGLSPAECSLLDVGSAAGMFLSAVGDVFNSKLGIDIDAAAIRFGAAALTQPLIAADLDDTRVLDRAPYDVLTCFHVLEHVDDPLELVRKMSDLIRDGGLMIVAMPMIPNGKRSINFYKEFTKRSDQLDLASEHIHHFSRLSARMLASRAGLHEVDCYVWNYKGDASLPEIVLTLRKNGGLLSTQPADATVWQSLRMLASIVRWAMTSKLRRIAYTRRRHLSAILQVPAKHQ